MAREELEAKDVSRLGPWWIRGPVYNYGKLASLLASSYKQRLPAGHSQPGLGRFGVVGRKEGVDVGWKGTARVIWRLPEVLL